MINFVLRFDDPSPTSNHELERDIFSVLKDADVPATVAVVPLGTKAGAPVPIAPTNVPHLIEAHAAGVIEVAQHGYGHIQTKVTSRGDPSEFWGTDENHQLQRITTGRKLLENAFQAPVLGFVPPWNTHDDVTMQVLASQRYSYISGSFATPPLRPSDLRLFPRTSHVRRLIDAHAQARRYWWMDTYVIAIMHHYDFQNDDGSSGSAHLAHFRKDLFWLRAQRGVRFITLGALAKQLDIGGTWPAYRRHEKKQRLHWRLQRLLPSELLLTQPLWLYLTP